MYYQDENGNIVLKKKIKKSVNKVKINNSTMQKINSMNNNSNNKSIDIYKKRNSNNIKKTGNIKNLKLQKSKSNTCHKIIYTNNNSKSVRKNNTLRNIKTKEKLKTQKNKISNNIKYKNDKYLKTILFKVKQNEIFLKGTIFEDNQKLNIQNQSDTNYVSVKTNSDVFIIIENKNETKEKDEKKNKGNNDIIYENEKIVTDEDYENENDFGVIYIK